MAYISEGVRVFQKEIEAAQKTCDALTDTFNIICDAVDKCGGNTVLTGMGKSGYICRKIAATMQSLGIKAIYLHPAEAMHGDLGMLTKRDILIAVSNSGETDEVLALIPAVSSLEIPIYSIVGRKNSTLSRFSKSSIVLPEIHEAYLDSLVPTCSTTVTLMIGDAMAVAVASKRGFSGDHFKMFHPHGSIGKRLTLTVESLMLSGEENAIVISGSKVSDAVFEMCRKPIGGVNIVDDNGELLGIFTDGDLRRLYKANKGQTNDLMINTVMTAKPVVLQKTQLISEVIETAKANNNLFSFYPVVQNNKLIGSLRMLDVSKCGLL